MRDMAGRQVIYLHVGAPKTGTTYLQSILWNNREALRGDGVLYPGDDHLFHTRAALDLLDRRFADYEDPAVPGTWRRLVDEARAWHGTVLISHELLSPASPEHVDRALADLGFAEVHVVCTARDLVRQAPAMWQQNLRSRDTQTFEEFVAELRKSSDASFWRHQDVADVLARWSRRLPPERVHLVTVPPPGAPQDVLWTRFCQVTGLEAEAYPTSSAVAHESLGIAEASLLRRINLALDDAVQWPVYLRSINTFIGTEVLGGRPGSRKIVLSGPDRAWMAERSREMVDRLRMTGYDIVGDLADLLPADEPDAPRPNDASDADMLDAAIECVAALVLRLQHRRDARRDEVSGAHPGPP